MNQKRIFFLFYALVCISLLAPVVYTQELLFPFITTKALFFRVFVLAALPFYAYLVAANKNLRPDWKNPVTITVCAFLGISLLSVFTSINPIKSMWGNYERMTGVFYLFTLTLLYFYVLLIAKFNGKSALRLFQWLVIISVGLSVYGLWVRLGLPGFFADPSFPRISSMFGNPIFFGGFLILPISLALFFLFQSENRALKVWYGFAVAIQLLGLFMSQTRGALMGIIIGAIIAAISYVFLVKNEKLRRTGIVILVGLALVGVLLFVVGGRSSPGSMLYRITHLKDTNSQSRLIQWRVALEGFVERPILGTGTENYSYVANKFYNPALFEYDRSWFDKPHNYVLEILVTNGILGLIAFVSLFVASLYVMIRALRSGFISALEASILAGGLIAYQVQNIFVFDTVGPSMMFFAFTGFCGFLWQEAVERKEEKMGKVKQWPVVAFIIMGIVVLYGLYATVYLPYKAAVLTNYGYAYTKADVRKAYDYFERARQVPFQFDFGETASKYGEFATSLATTPGASENKEIVNQCMDAAIDALEKTVARVDSYAIYWYQLSVAYATRASFNGRPFDPKAEEAIERAVELAPTKIEILTYLAQVRALQGRSSEARTILADLAEMYPTSLETKWRFSLITGDLGNMTEAVRIGEEALEAGYIPRVAAEYNWLINYYVSIKNWSKAISLYQDLKVWFPKDVQVRAGLAKTYADMGDKERAIITAKEVLEIDPAAQESVDKFIQSIR